MPRVVVPLARTALALPFDIRDWVFGTRPALVPPRRLWFVGDIKNAEEYLAHGIAFLEHCRRFAHLRPEESVLDVGCGVGRMAVALTSYLTGRYEGFDIVRSGIRWCQRTITPSFPSFHFQHADVWNPFYNRGGRYRAAEYRFPYGDESFDFVFLTSVFTHMLPLDVEHYLREISRVLKPDGRCLGTYFILNDESRRLMARPGSALDFRYEHDGYRSIWQHRPEAAVAYDEQAVREMHDRCGLDIREPIHYGGWSGRAPHVTFQDFVISQSRKSDGAPPAGVHP